MGMSFIAALPHALAVFLLAPSNMDLMASPRVCLMYVGQIFNAEIILESCSRPSHLVLLVE